MKVLNINIEATAAAVEITVLVDGQEKAKLGFLPSEDGCIGREDGDWSDHIDDDELADLMEDHFDFLPMDLLKLFAE
jgi:hypothetical protein